VHDTAEPAEPTVSVVIDEDLDVHLHLHFGEGVRAETVAYRGWKGLKNGMLLQAMTDAGDVDVFITADQNLRHQQRLATLPFGIVILRAPSKRLARMLELMPEVLRLLPTVRPGIALEVGAAREPSPPATGAPAETPAHSAVPAQRPVAPVNKGKGRKI
jgi:hypothetical protein